MAKPTVKIMVYMPPDLYARLEAKAVAKELSAFMVQAAIEKLERETA